VFGRYMPSLRGVLLSHKGHTFAQKVALMYAEGPYPTTEIEFDAGVWAPEVGMRISEYMCATGKHVIYGAFYFNVSGTHLACRSNYLLQRRSIYNLTERFTISALAPYIRIL
jgi:hypothetical protein